MFDAKPEMTVNLRGFQRISLTKPQFESLAEVATKLPRHVTLGFFFVYLHMWNVMHIHLSNIYYNLHYILLILGICLFQSTSKVPYIKTLNKQSSWQNGQQQVRPLRSASLQTQSSKTNDIALAMQASMNFANWKKKQLSRASQIQILLHSILAKFFLVNDKEFYLYMLVYYIRESYLYRYNPPKSIGTVLLTAKLVGGIPVIS